MPDGIVCTLSILWLFVGHFYLSHPALRIIARLRKIAKQVQVTLFSAASALLALVNIELPLAASPPIPSPLGLCKRTKRINIIPDAIQIQERIEVIVSYLEELSFKYFLL